MDASASVGLFICLSVRPSIFLSKFQSLYMYVSVRRSIRWYLSVCPSVCPSVCTHKTCTRLHLFQQDTMFLLV